MSIRYALSSPSVFKASSGISVPSEFLINTAVKSSTGSCTTACSVFSNFVSTSSLASVISLNCTKPEEGREGCESYISSCGVSCTRALKRIW